MQKLINIVTGNYYRLIGKNNSLYAERNKFCEGCPFNSKHKQLTLIQKAWKLLGDFCTDCGCPLESKLRDPLSECPQDIWGQAKN